MWVSVCGIIADLGVRKCASHRHFADYVVGTMLTTGGRPVPLTPGACGRQGGVSQSLQRRADCLGEETPRLGVEEHGRGEGRREKGQESRSGGLGAWEERPAVPEVGTAPDVHPRCLSGLTLVLPWLGKAVLRELPGRETGQVLSRKGKASAWGGK